MVGTVLIALSMHAPASAADSLSASRRTAIVTAVEKVLPATVTIGAERVAVQQVNPFRSLHNEFFSDWFSDPFFGGFRRVVRMAVLGSGIIVDPTGLVITNDHVVADAENIQVTLSDGRVFPAKLRGRGLPLDLALLEIDQPKGAKVDLPYVTLGTASDLALGEWAIAIGAPSNLEASVTAGVISAVDRRLPAKQDYTYLGMIQTDAAINPGNSGGPLVNADGRVVGVNTVIMSQSGGSEGLGFAIPADHALKVIDDLRVAGEIRPAWFGWELEEDKEAGLVVREVHPSGPAAAAGVRSGMELKEIETQKIRTMADYEKLLLSVRIGQTVSVRVTGDSAGRTLRLKARVIPEELIRVDLGLDVQDVSIQYRRRVGTGVVVRDIRSTGIFGKMDQPTLAPGDILVSIAGAAVESVQAYKDIQRRLKKGMRVEFVIRRQNVLYTFTVRL